MSERVLKITVFLFLPQVEGRKNLNWKVVKHVERRFSDEGVLGGNSLASGVPLGHSRQTSKQAPHLSACRSRRHNGRVLFEERKARAPPVPP